MGHFVKFSPNSGQSCHLGPSSFHFGGDSFLVTGLMLCFSNVVHLLNSLAHLDGVPFSVDSLERAQDR